MVAQHASLSPSTIAETFHWGCQVGKSKKNRHSWPISKLRVGAKNWGPGICILYICVLFDLKFSNGQFAPKPDSPAQNRTPGNPTFHRVTLLKNMSQLIFQSLTELWIFYFLTYSVPSLNSNCRYHVADQCWQHRDVCMSALSSVLVTAVQCKWMKNTSHTSSGRLLTARQCTLTQRNRAAYLV